ncbi:MAG: hypothetical protein FJZ90_04870 [Chloroflexi bacterium]|nr:hypothetical protein [Chloroflexota bacterium]
MRYLILWDFPTGGGQAPKRYTFYRILSEKDLRGGFTLLQRSVALATDPGIAAQLAALAWSCGAAKVNTFEVIADSLGADEEQAAKAAIDELLSQRLRRRGRRGAAG